MAFVILSIQIRMDKKERNIILNAFVVPIILVGLMWSVFYLEHFDFIHLRSWGIRPKEAKGLIGIFLTPFLHGSLEHLFNNSVPMIVLGGTLFYFYREVAYKTLIWILIMGGFWVWVSARPGTNHIGMSGIVYGLVAFLFFSGIMRKHARLISISLLMIFMYGSLIWGIFPIKEGVSWEGHLWGAISGVILAWYFREEGQYKRKVYQWELDEIAELEELERLKNEPQIHTTMQDQEIVYHWKESKKHDN